MNILIYTPIAFEISETFIQNQFRYQSKHNVIGICHKKPDNGIIINNKVFKISAIPINLFDKLLSYILRKIKKNKYAFSYYTERKIIKIINDNKIDIIHCNYGTSGLRFLNIIKKTNIPFVVHFHGIDASKQLEDKPYIQKLPELFNIIKKVIVVSDDMKERLTPFFSKKDLSKMKVIPYGVDIKKILSLKRKEGYKNRITILHLGRITLKKGVLDLVKVYNSILNKTSVNLHLNIVGDGIELENIKSYIKEENIEKFVTLFGSQKHETAIEQLRNADIFVLNSRVAPDGDKEGFPNVIIEAMACESAIVSTYHAGIPMAITNEKDGLLVEEKNNEELENALLRLIENKDERILFAKNAKEKALNNFSVKTMIEKYNEIYESF